jgi:ABC-type nitrate/sulfonate/bicarbonate transport system substrate-binding protein
MSRSSLVIVRTPLGGELSRRNFLLGSSAAAALAALAACGGGSSSSGSGGGSKGLGVLTVQLNWLHDVEFGGDYLAQDRKYAQDAGFSGMEITPGGPSISAEPAVVSGQALLGYSGPDLVAQANTQGADLRIIGATLKRNPYIVMSPVAKPLMTPADLVGKKIAVDTQNDVGFAAFLRANGIDPADVTTVPGNFDPTLLSSGQVDGYHAYANSEPITLAQSGFDTHQLALEDFKYPSIGDVYIATASTITDEPEKLKAALRAVLRGWQDFVTRNSDAVPLTIAAAGSGSTATAEFWQAEADVTREYLLADAEADGGLLLVPPAQQAQVIASLGLGGITATEKDLFDMSLLTQVLQETGMSAVPTPA